MKATTSNIVFTRTDDADVQAFRLTGDNVIIPGKDECDKAYCVFSYLGAEDRASYRTELVMGCLLTEKGRNYVAVCDWFGDRYGG